MSAQTDNRLETLNADLDILKKNVQLLYEVSQLHQAMIRNISQSLLGFAVACSPGQLEDDGAAWDDLLDEEGIVPSSTFIN